MFHHLNAPFKKGGSHGEGQDCGKQNHHARGDVDVEVKFSVQQVAGSDQDCADGEVDEDGDQGAVVGFYVRSALLMIKLAALITLKRCSHILDNHELLSFTSN